MPAILITSKRFIMLARPRELTYLEYTFAPKDLKEGF
jgi:hypothetical protein